MILSCPVFPLLPPCFHSGFWTAPCPDTWPRPQAQGGSDAGPDSPYAPGGYHDCPETFLDFPYLAFSCLPVKSPRKEHDKFISANAGHYVIFPAGSLKDSSHLSEYGVPRRMAHGIIDALKII